MTLSSAEMTGRHQNIRAAMAAHDIDVLLLCGSATLNNRGIIHYITGCHVPVFEEIIVMPAKGPIGFFSYSRDRIQCASEFFGVEHAEILIPQREGKTVANFLKKFTPSTIGHYGFESLSANLYLSLLEHLQAWPLQEMSQAVDLIRMQQSDEELTLSEKAVALNEAVLHAYTGFIARGASEADAIQAASAIACEQGCEDQFWLTGSGAAACAPPSLAKRRNHRWKSGEVNTIIIEHSGPGGYFGEVMHSIFIGPPSPVALRAFNVISDAQQAARRLIKPGVTVGSVADEIDNFIYDHNFYSESERRQVLGHGQGLDITEPPLLQHGNSTVICCGMRLNIHPVITLVDGSRIVSTDCVVATSTGSRRLSSLPYTPIIITPKAA